MPLLSNLMAPKPSFKYLLWTSVICALLACSPAILPETSDEALPSNMEGSDVETSSDINSDINKTAAADQSNPPPRNYKPRSSFAKSAPAKLPTVEPKGLLSPADISLGEPSFPKEERVEAAPFIPPEIITRPIAVSHPGDLFDVTVSSDDFSTFRVGLIKTGEDASVKNLILDRRNNPLTKDPVFISDVGLKSGDYTLLVRAANKDAINIQINRKAAPKFTLKEKGTKAAPVSSPMDMMGDVNAGTYYFRPDGLVPEGVYTLTLSSQYGTMSSSVLGQDGAVVDRRGGGGVLRYTSLKGDQWSVILYARGSKLEGNQALFRARVTPEDRPTDHSEADALTTLSHDDIRNSLALSAYRDKSDTDVFLVEAATEGTTSRPFTIKYSGPYTSLVAEAGSDGISVNSRSITLGPFSNLEPLQLKVGSKGDPGPYDLSFAPVSDKGAVALEPDNTGRSDNRFAKDERVSGSISHSNDRDYITFDLGDEAQLWRALILGETLGQVTIKSRTQNIFDRRRRVDANTRRKFPIDDLYMGPGPVTFGIQGRVGDYRIALRPLGKPNPSLELEPNQGAFSRLIDFGQTYRGRLPVGDTDIYSVFLEKPATVELSYDVPAGGRFRLSHAVNGGGEERRESLEDNNSLAFDLPPGTHDFTFTSPVTSPAEYKFTWRVKPAFVSDLNSVRKIKPNLPTLQAFSRDAQRLDLSNISDLPLQRPLQFWSPAAKLSFDPLTNILLAAPDLVTDDYPVWVASADASDSVGFIIQAHPNVPPVGPSKASLLPPNMMGGINVALASLGAKIVDQEGYTLDEAGVLPRSNPSNAHNIGAMIDGVKALTNDGGWYTNLRNNSDEIYQPIIDLPGDDPIPIIGVGLTKRLIFLSDLEAFAVDISTDGQTWTEVLSDKLTTSDGREIFAFPDGAIEARFVRLRPLSDGRRDKISINEFEVFAQPGASGLTDIALLDKTKGALGRLTKASWHARNSTYGLDPVKEGYIIRGLTDDGFTDIQLVHSFKNQSIAEIEAIELFFGGTQITRRGKAVYTPNIVRLHGSVSGPMGPFNQQIDLEIPASFGVGESLRLDLPERLVANAVKIEYFANNNDSDALQIPAYYELYERPESQEYASVFGLAEEYRARPYKLSGMETKAAIRHSGALMLLPGTGVLHSGRVQLGKQVNRWTVEREGNANTLVLTVRGERGFFPKVVVKTPSGETLSPLTEAENTLKSEHVWEYDFSENTLQVTVSEPPRSTIFLTDQSPSAVSYIPRSRQSIIAYAEQMVEGEDRVQFGSFGNPLLSKEWITDPNKFKRALIDYTLGGNSSGEAAMTSASDLFKGLSGTRSIVVFGDGDFDSSISLMPKLSENNVRVFPIKISSARIWGDPIISMSSMTQYANTSGGELAYVLKEQDITDAFSRVTARLLGEKPYVIFAEQNQRIIEPGELLVTLEEAGGSDETRQQETAYHVLFDASGSMLKRVGETRRIAIAKSAVTQFIEDKLSETQIIGLRQFGGRPDQCDTQLILPATIASKSDFMTAIDAIAPINNAKTPIAKALAELPNDLADQNGPVQVLLLTDGEETCEGDAGAIIDDLINSNIANRLDIISFSLGPDIDRKPFEDWAERGRGLYIDAQDSEGLSEALEQTAKETFNVIGGDGTVVSTALIGGDPISLPVGQYTIRARGQSYPIEISGQETTRLSVQ